ncbi:MAG: ceramidase domain-containing protein [Bacteroidota bacterium]
MNARLSSLLIPFGVFIGTSLLLGLAICYNWMGEANEGTMMFCERARDGLIKQPANSFSNLGFSLVGLYIGWYFFCNKIKKRNLFGFKKQYHLLMAIVLILLGAGSFAMHATNTFWGIFFDLLGMFLSSAFFFCYSLKRWLRFSDGAFLVLYLLNVALCCYVFLSPWNYFGYMLSSAEILFILHIAIALILEVYMTRCGQIQVDWRWAAVGVLTLITAFGIWNISRTHTSLWCNPDSLFQGHALWHILDAASLYAFFKYYCSESTPVKVYYQQMPVPDAKEVRHINQRSQQAS